MKAFLLHFKKHVKVLESWSSAKGNAHAKDIWWKELAAREDWPEICNEDMELYERHQLLWGQLAEYARASATSAIKAYRRRELVRVQAGPY